MIQNAGGQRIQIRLSVWGSQHTAQDPTGSGRATIPLKTLVSRRRPAVGSAPTGGPRAGPTAPRPPPPGETRPRPTQHLSCGGQAATGSSRRAPRSALQGRNCLGLARRRRHPTHPARPGRGTVPQLTRAAAARGLRVHCPVA